MAKSTAKKGTQDADITSAKALKEFLQGLKNKMSAEESAAIFVLSAMNYVLNLPNIYDILNKENKEIARDLWLRLKAAGLDLTAPPALFTPEELS